MLYHLLFPMADQFAVLNVFRYLTFRTGGAIITALIISFLFGPVLINLLKSSQNGGQPIRDDGPEGHILTKQGTPTMGGFLILLALSLATLLWADLRNGFVWAVLGVTIAYGTIGFLDDYLKVIRRDASGLSAKLKLLLQAVIAVVATFSIMSNLPEPLATTLAVPFLKNVLLNLGWLFVVFAVLVMVGASNAVNLTDGLDGLAIVPVMIAAGVFALIAYLVGNSFFSNYLQLHYVPGAGELVQRAAGQGVHGRYRCVVAGGRLGCRQRGDQARTGARHRRRVVRSGDHLGDRPGGVVQVDGKKNFRHGAAAPSLRKEGMGGEHHCHPVLDHRLHPGSGRPFNVEAEVTGWR